MAQRHQRVLALVLALLFLATSVAAGAAVIWQIAQDNKQNTAEKPGDTTTDPAQPADKEALLQGTKLQNFTPVADVDELQSTDTKVGDGKEAKTGGAVTAHYTGAVAKTGVIFESSHDRGQPATFPLDQVIKGWQEGVPGMKEGGIRRLVIPAELAYGAKPPDGSGIPPNAALVFDIELVTVQ